MESSQSTVQCSALQNSGTPHLFVEEAAALPLQVDDPPVPVQRVAHRPEGLGVKVAMRWWRATAEAQGGGLAGAVAGTPRQRRTKWTWCAVQVLWVEGLNQGAAMRPSVLR